MLLACLQWECRGLARRMPSRGAGAWRSAPLLPWRVQCPGRVCAALAAGSGGLGPVPGFVSSPFPPSHLEVPALCVAGRPIQMSLILARWYAIPCGLCVPRAPSGCPSGLPRVSLACSCARALAAFAPQPPSWVDVARAPRAVPVLGAGRAVPRGLCPSACPASVLCAVWLALGGGGGPVPFPPCLAWGCVPPFGRALRVCGRGWGCGGCGRVDPSPTPQRALLRAGFACCGGGLRAAGGGASRLAVGPPTRALSQPRPLVLWGVRPGPTTHWLWVRGVRAWEPFTKATVRALPSWLCALWGRREGARRGRLLPGCVASGVRRSCTPDPSSFGACGRGPPPTGCGCGGCGRVDPSPYPQRALLRAGFARCPVPRTGASEATERIRHKDPPDWSVRGGVEHGPSPQTGSSGEEPCATDWSVRGDGEKTSKRCPGLEHPGRSGARHKPPYWIVRGGTQGHGPDHPRQRREYGKKTPRIGASGADRSKAQNPGLDRPGVHPVPRTGTSGDATHPDWNVR